jgi:sulfopyruvate decarboxylase TPP-binding subunit
MFDGPSVVAALRSCGVSDVVWLPDSELGRWDVAFSAAADLRLIRVCREGEAIGVAAGLLLGGRRPLVMIQCTGLFEAGDALRNFIHDLRLPLFFLIGVRSLHALRRGGTTDTCPVFTEPILQAWRLPYVVVDPEHDTPDALAREYRKARDENRAGAVLLVE